MLRCPTPMVAGREEFGRVFDLVEAAARGLAAAVAGALADPADPAGA